MALSGLEVWLLNTNTQIEGKDYLLSSADVGCFVYSFTYTTNLNPA